MSQILVQHLPDEAIKEGEVVLFEKDGKAAVVRIENALSPHAPGQRTSVWVRLIKTYQGLLPPFFFAQHNDLYPILID